MLISVFYERMITLEGNNLELNISQIPQRLTVKADSGKNKHCGKGVTWCNSCINYEITLVKLSHTKKSHKKTPWPQVFCCHKSSHGALALHGAMNHGPIGNCFFAQVSATFHCGHGHRFGVLDGDVELRVG